MEFYSDPIPYIIIDDMYTEDELKQIWVELDFLTNEFVMRPPEETGTARDAETQEPLKQNSGVFLDGLYSNRAASYILRLNRKLFVRALENKINEQHWFWNNLTQSTQDNTLISYYDEADYYKAHSDVCPVTAITWFNKEPKSFEGGDLVLPEYNITIPYKNNRCFIFPGRTKHEVTDIKMVESREPFSGYGRYTMTQFIT